ncbi:MAG: ABC transporter ATP-binding protein [Planctomycetota bacterium]
MKNNTIHVHNLSFRAGKRQILENVEFELAAGTVTAILGRNGAGKSTLLRILTGLLLPTTGDVTVLGESPTRHGAALRRKIGYVPDAIELPTWMRIIDYFRFCEPFYPSWNRSLSDSLLSRLSLDPTLLFRTLSKGERTKVALIAALTHEPELLILDEPFSGLDAIARREILETLIEQIADRKHSVLFVSHSLADVERLADSVALLDNGRFVWNGSLDDARALMQESPAAGAHPERAFDLQYFFESSIANAAK